MNKNAKHNLLEMAFHLLVGIVFLAAYTLYEGISRGIVFLIIICPCVIVISCVLLIFVVSSRPYKKKTSKTR